MESEHWCTLLLLTVQLVGLQLTFADWQGFRLIAGQVLGHGLHIKEYWFFSDTIVILSMDDKFSAVLHFTTVDDEGVVISYVALHVLHTLFQLNIIVVP